jgi:hypothetical protein
MSNVRSIQTSLFSLTNNSTNPNNHSVAIKDTDISTSYSHYAFGTSMFFAGTINDVVSSGGLGFFTSANGNTGYYVSVQTTTHLSDTADKEIKIYKVVNGKKTILNDSQKAPARTLTGVLAGSVYKLDVNVSVESSSVKIDVYVNSYKITATDSSSPLSKTKNVAMFASSGKVNYDYIYAAPITEDQYKSGTMQNVYEGKYGIKTISFLYGDKILENKNISSGQTAWLEEFGTTARELKQIKIKYQDRPADPLFATIGINKLASILGQRLTSFGAEVFVLNNSGMMIPLSDGNLYSFAVIGNAITISGEHEYSSNTLSDTTTPEPVVFETAWIQREDDAKNLGTWIQSQWSKQQRVIEMEIFSNPLISVGDIITINYPKNDLNGTQKFVVTRVNNSFREGLSTSISARSIYS